MNTKRMLIVGSAVVTLAISSANSTDIESPIVIKETDLPKETQKITLPSVIEKNKDTMLFPMYPTYNDGQFIYYPLIQSYPPQIPQTQIWIDPRVYQYGNITQGWFWPCPWWAECINPVGMPTR